MEQKRHLFTYDGIMLSGVIIISNECMKLCGESIPAYLYAGLTLAGTIAFDILYRERKEEKIFKTCGLETNDDKIPLIIKKNPHKEVVIK